MEEPLYSYDEEKREAKKEEKRIKKELIMKVELSISDAEEICEFFWWKYQDEQEKYLASHNEIATHCDEYDPEKEHELYMHFYKSDKYFKRYYHWKDILDDMEKKENSRK
jgi:hypothetical protein